ncbi:Uncharacterised protein [uncultured archaeon]|nr:Uncharacterised protein [uncultured archaeon]
MKRFAILMLTTVFLVFTLAPVLAQMGSANPKQTDDRGKNMMDQGKSIEPGKMMEQGKSMREDLGMQGMGFLHRGENEFGDYVTFAIDNKTGSVLNYAISGYTLFNISIPNFNYGSTSSRGSVTRISNIDGSIVIQLHDNPAAVINILSARSTSIVFTLANGATAAKEDNLIRIEEGSVTGYISGVNITGSVSGSQVTINAPPSSAVIFRAAPLNMPMSDQLYRRFSQEIAGKRMGMEIALGRNGTYSSVNYSETMQLRVQEMEQNRIRLVVNGTEQSGRIIAIDLDNSSLAVGARDRLRIHYDDKTLQCVDDPNIVFNGTDQPLCWISPVQDGARAQLMMYIPHFSEHTIDIVVEPAMTATPVATPTMTPAAATTTVLPMVTPKAPGFGFVVSLAALLSLIYLTGRRKR